MKKILLIMCACLMGALSGAKAWTYVDPENGRWYYLFNIGTSQAFFKGTSALYSANTNVVEATPVKVEESGSKHKLAFLDGVTTYRIYQSEGTGDPDNTSGVDFTFDGSAASDWGYRLESKNGGWFEPDRYMTWNGTYLEFKKEKYDNIRDWQFIAYEEVLPSIVEAKAATCASTAATIVSGWERVTTKEQLAQNPERYFYAIFSAVNPGVMMTTEDNNDAYRMCYKAAENPSSSSSYDLFEMENYDGEFAIKSNITGKYYGNSSGEPWNFIADQDALNGDCKVTVTCSNGVFNLQDKYADGNAATDEFVGNYLGAWDNMEFVGERLAGNKGIKRAGYFLIYRKLKVDIDMTARMSSAADSWIAASGTKKAYDGGVETYNGDDNQFAAGNVLYQTINNLPNGNYEVTFYAWENFSDWNPGASIAYGSGIAQAFVNNNAQAFTVIKNTGGRGWNDENKYSLPCLVTDGTLTYGVRNIAAGGNWAVCRPISLTYLGEPATEADYDVLQNAVTKAETKMLGFEAGEYAPYSNVSAVKALAAAKAIDPMMDNARAYVLNLADEMADECWTANTKEVSAIPYGDFATYFTVGGQDFPYGWNLYNTGNNSRIMGGTEGTSNVGLAATSSGKALLLKFNATYGEETGYTMPLKGGKVYKISFLYGGWGNQPNTIVSLTDPNDKEITLAPNFRPATTDANSNVDDWYNYSGLFVATVDGDYKIHFNKVESGQQQIVIGDIDIKLGDPILTVTDGAALPALAPGTYPSATYSRTLTLGNKWGTICVPFNLKSDENIQFYNVSSIGYGVLNVETVAEVAAGTPAIFKKLVPEATISVTTNEATVVSAPAEAESGTNAKLVGTFTGTTIEGESAGNYFYVKTDQFWRGNEKFTIPAYRAYVADISVADPGARLMICVDGENPTAITAIEAAEAEDGALKDGKYLINNKVVLVKNGVKYGANGQKLN